MDTSISKELNNAFFPRSIEKRKIFKKSNEKLAYYTTLETAKKILQNKELWMRNASSMNDFGEVRYGIDRLRKLLYAPGDNELLDVIQHSLDGSFFEILRKELCKFFNPVNGESASWQYNTYITSFTSHKLKEQKDGRLSMWRTYGGDNGVAVVFKAGVLFDSLENRNIFMSPVEYIDEGRLKKEIVNLADSLKKNKEFLAKNFHSVEGEKIIEDRFMWALRFAATSVKHPGFAEENEWRLIANGIDLNKELNRPGFELENVKGNDQLVFKIKFEPEEFFDMIDCVLIGPNADLGIRNIAQKALVRIVSDSFRIKEEEAEKKVRGSDIPYRPF